MTKKDNNITMKTKLKRAIALFALVAAFFQEAAAYDPVMTEVHDFTGLTNTTNLGNYSNAVWTGEGNKTLESIDGRTYYSWVDGSPRFTFNASTDRWRIDNNVLTFVSKSEQTFTINRLDAGDEVTIIFTNGTCTMACDNSSTVSNDNTISSNTAFTVKANGDIVIRESNWTRIERITIKTKHIAEYDIVDAAGGGQTFRFISGGVLADKRAAVQYMTMSFGSLKDLTYVKKMPTGSFAATSVVHEYSSEDFDFLDNTRYPDKSVLPGKEYTIYSGNSASNWEPIYGSFYYFYPEVDGVISARVYTKRSDPLGYDNGNPINEPLTFFDRTAGTVLYADGKSAAGEYTIANISVKKDHAYYLCDNPLEPRTHPVHSLIDYTFVPVFHLSTLYGTLENGATSNGATDLATVTHTSGVTIGVRNISYLGNITGATIYIDSSNKLHVTGITYTAGDRVNKGGVIIAEIYGTKSDGNGGTVEVGNAKFVLTVAYSAENIDGSGDEVKKWDFYSDVLAIGQYKTSGSQLRIETDKEDADWLKTYMNLHTNQEPIFKSVYDMEGDNADMIVETEGLIFIAKSNRIGLYNENDKNEAVFTNRYVGLLPGGRLIIPKLKTDDRVRILMDRYGAADASVEAKLRITNGRDVNLTNYDGTKYRGTLIENDYEIGGSTYRYSGGKCVLYGDYNFIVDHDGDFSIDMIEGKLLKFYRIEIYRSTNFVTTNGVLRNNDADDYEMLNPDGEKTVMWYTLHNHGKGERITVLRVDQNKMYTQDSEDPLAVNFVENTPGAATVVSYTPPVGSFGSYRVMLGNKTISGTVYITDRAERTMAVGYRETKKYPYTWDFTDLSNYTSTIFSDYFVDNNKDDEEDSDELVVNSIIADNRNWSTNGPYACLREATKNENQEGHLFASGSQLYAHNHMFPETAGLGFKRNTSVSDTKSFNNSVQLKIDDGLIIRNSGETSYHKIEVPEVDNNAAIYVRATPDGANTIAKWSLADNTSATNMTSFNVANSDDKIYVFQNTTGSKQNFDLWFNNLLIKKIAVSTAPKTVNKYGWATESREYDIDPELTSYMTGQNFTTFLVTGVDYPSKKVTMTPIYDIEHNFRMPFAEPTGDRNKNACIIYNNAGTSVDIIDGGFHLFVPDMHEGDNVADEGDPAVARKPYADTSTSQMKAKLSSEGVVLASEGDYTNFAFTYLYHDTEDGSIPSGTTLTDGGQAFYRIATGGATSVGHQGYLPLLTANIPNDVMSGSRGFTMSFGNDDLTGVELVQNMVPKADVYYNLNGQQLNGQPSRQGLYIVNGKKMYVK